MTYAKSPLFSFMRSYTMYVITILLPLVEGSKLHADLINRQRAEAIACIPRSSLSTISCIPHHFSVDRTVHI